MISRPSPALVRCSAWALITSARSPARPADTLALAEQLDDLLPRVLVGDRPHEDLGLREREDLGGGVDAEVAADLRDRVPDGEEAHAGAERGREDLRQILDRRDRCGLVEGEQGRAA